MTTSTSHGTTPVPLSLGGGRLLLPVALLAVGADLLDLADGTVRFRVQIDCESINLVWRLGEPVLDAAIERRH